MPKELFVLNVEDSKTNSTRLAALLKKAGYKTTLKRVESEPQMRSALKKRTWDVIVSAHRLAKFSSTAALALLHETEQDVPFLVTGGKIGEQAVAELMSTGVQAFVLKENLAGLIPAVERELGRVKQRKEQNNFDSLYRSLIENSIQGIAIFQGTHMVFANPALSRMNGYANEELMAMSAEQIFSITHPEDRAILQERFKKRMAGEAISPNIETRIVRKDGTTGWVQTYTDQIQYGGQPAILSTLIDITESKQAIAALHFSENRFRALMENSLDDVSLVGADGTLIWESPSVVRNLGYPPDKLLGNNILQLLHPEDADGIQYLFAELVDKPDSRQFGSFRLRRMDGTWRWVEAVATNMLNDPSVQAVVINYRDVTERRNMQDEISIREQNYRSILAQASDGIFAINSSGRFIDVNPSGCAMLGYTLEELLAIKMADLFPPQDLAADPLRVDELAQGKTVFSERRMIRKDATLLQIEISARMLADGSFQGVLHDVTERKRMEDALAQSEHEHRTLFENVPVGLYRTSAEGYMLDANPAMIRIFGYQDLESFTAVKVEKLYVDPSVNKQFYDEMDKGDIIISMQAEFRKKDGTTFWAEDNIRAIRDEQGNPLFYEGSLMDITERKQTEQILAESEARYRQAITAADAIPYSLSYSPNKYTFVGEGITKLAGYPIEGMTPAQLDSLIVESFMQGSFKGMAMPEAVRLVREGKSGALWKCEHRIRTSSGEERWLSDSSIQVLGENGMPKGSIGIFQDITERKLAENKLLESERRYRELYANMPAMFFTIDADGNTLTVNDFGAAQLGYIQEELVGQPVLKVFFEEDKEQAVSYVRNCLDHPQQTFQWELRKVRKDGSMLWVKETAWAVNNQQGEAIVLIVCEDITERKQAQEVVRGSEVRYRSLFEDSPISLWEEDFSAVKLRLDTLKEEGVSDFYQYFASHPQAVLECISLLRIVDVNKATLKLFGAKEKSELLQNPVHIILTDPVEFAQRKIGFADELISIAQGKLHFEKEAIHQTLDGRKIILRLSLSVMEGYEDTLSKVIISMVDITGHIQAERAIRESERSLRESQMIAGLGSYVLDITTGMWTNSDILDQIFGIDETYVRSVEGWLAMMHEGWKQEMADYFANEVLGDHIRFDKEYKITRKNDGAERWVHGLGELEFDDHKQPVKMRGTIQDITERKQAEWAMRNSEGRYRALFEEMPISIWEEDFSEAKKYLDSLKESGVTDFPTYFKTHPESFLACAMMIKIIDVNQATLKMYHATSKQDLYKSMDEGLSESEVEHMSQALLAIAEGKISHSWEGPDETIDGKPIEISLNWKVSPGHESDFSKVIVTTLDITDRKHSEEALQKSERRFRALIANAGDLIVVVNPNGVIQYASPSSENILGYKPEDTTGRKLSNWVHPEDLAAVLDSLASRNKEPGVAQKSIKARGRHKDGTWRILESIGTSLIHEPAIEGIVLNIRDITEREFAEEALRTSEAQFRAIFEGAAIGIALVDADGYLVKHNLALEEMLGYDDLELRSMTFPSFTHPDDVKNDWTLWTELISGKRDHYEIEKRYIHKSGRIIWGKLVTSVVPDADGKIMFGVGMVEDITERKYREREQQAQASITQVINQGLDMDLLLQNLLGAALHAVPPAEKGSILLLNTEGILKIRALNGYSDPRIGTASFPSTSGYSARAVREGHAFMIADAHAGAPTRYNFEIEEMDAIQSAIVAPLMVKGRAIGAISLDNASRKEAFGPAELATLTTFASSAALVIQNTRLLEETSQRIAELELLYESGLAISQLLSPKEIGEKIIDLLEQKMNWHHTAIRLYNAENETLELLAYHQPDIKNTAERLAVEARIKSLVSHPSEGLSGWVIQHGETVRTGALKNDARYVETFAGLHSGLYVPIKTGDRVIGVISIESEKENAFSKSDEQLTTILATQAAGIFENARLYEDTFQRAVELEKRVSERTAQIEATKRRLELATHAGQIGVWEYNPRENKVIWDERMHQIHQIPFGEFDGTSQSWAKLIYADDLEHSSINQQLAMTKNLLTNNEYRIVWPDGSVRHIMASAVTANAADGTPERIIGINMDITERKQIEQSLRESETYARLLFDAVPDPVSVTEANGSIVDVNKVFEKQYQLVRAEIRGKHIAELSIYPDSELDKMETYISEVLQGQIPKPVELDFYVPGDRVHTLELHSYPLEVNGRHLVLNTSHDITSHKKAEEAQRLAKSEMERALRIKNEFLANMSHELRTPLNSILGISESLEEQIAGALNEKQLKYIGIVRESGRHLLELINDILDLSKIEAGRMELDIHHIYVDKLCLSSLRMVKELAQKKSLNIFYIVNEEVKVILGDERRLKQSLVNLLSNAVKFTPPGNRIGLEVFGNPEKNEVSFTVWDQGIGIAKKDIQHLFKPFVQLDAGLAREYQGTGLGLALVAQMVNLHGGRIELESEVKGGSRFTITLPWAPTEQATKAKVTSDLSLPGLISDTKGNGRILLVEDTDVVIQLISEYLRFKGYEILLAHNGVEGINLALQEHPDLILMDVMMPVMNGLEATENIRKDEALKDTPIIALTALAMAGDSERCLAAGMNDYLSKPIQMQDLAVMIEKYMSPALKGPHEQ
jgi:PAS domain S-box-containing protein